MSRGTRQSIPRLSWNRILIGTHDPPGTFLPIFLLYNFPSNSRTVVLTTNQSTNHHRLHHRHPIKKLKNMEPVDPAELRSQFLELLRSRRSPEVPLNVEPAVPVIHPLYQEKSPPKFSEAIASCPKENIPNLKDLLVEENLYLHTEASEQGRMPVLILSLKDSSNGKRPAIVFLHSTHKCKEWLRPLLEAYASRGYVAIAIDSRYHGERAGNISTYQDVNL